MSHRALLEDNLGLVDGVIRLVIRRGRMPAVEGEDFAASVRLKLVENDYEVLRKFKGRSSLRTYLAVVVKRLFCDHRNARWGRWRPSRQAIRLGATAIRLEELLSRDGHSFEEACQTLRVNYGVTGSPEVLQDLSLRFPRRQARRLLGEDALEDAPAPRAEPDAGLRAAELASLARRTHDALARARGRLEPQDQLLLVLRFDDGVPVSRIARLVGLDQRLLYRRIDQVMEGLRKQLEAEGIDGSVAADILGEPAVEWPEEGRTAAESGEPRQSTQVAGRTRPEGRPPSRDA